MDSLQPPTNYTSANITPYSNGTPNNSNSYETMGLVAVCIEGFLMITVLLGNGLIFAAFRRNEHLRTLTNYYILQLAIADFCVGFLMPVHMAMYLHRPMLGNIHTCVFRYTSMLLFQSASISALIALTCDRFIAVVWPLHYHDKLTLTRYWRSVIAVWFFPITLGFVLPMLWHNKWTEMTIRECDLMFVLKEEYLGYIMIPAFIVCTVVLISLYIKIFRVAHKHASDIAIRESIASQRKSSRHDKHKLKKDMKMVKTGMIVLGGFYICWTPFFLLCGIQVYGGLLDSVTMKHARNMALFPAIFNSALNPIIYSFRMPKFRSEFDKILHLKRTTVSVNSYTFSSGEHKSLSMNNLNHTNNASYL